MFALFKKNIFFGNKKIIIKECFKIDPSESNSYVESIYFDIIDINNNFVGYCDLRLGMNEELYYLGQVGYHIYNEYRGNNYAYEASLLIFKLAKNKYLMESLLITCNPENIASYKTLSKLNGKLVKIVDVPKNSSLFQTGDLKKCIFIYKL